MKITKLSIMLLIAIVCEIMALPQSSSANERHFSFIYESTVLPVDMKEIEVWHTERAGKDGYYRRIDQRLELEWGLVKDLQIAFYLNFSGKQTKDQTGTYTAESKQTSSSLELKYRLLDRKSDALGFALYGELTSRPDLLELETKLIADKQIGNVLIALNLVGEREWEREDQLTKRELMLEADLGIGYLFNSGIGLGLEFRNQNFYDEHKGVEHAPLYGGMTVSYNSSTWWATLSVTPQITDIKKGKRDYDEAEKVQARVLVGFHIK